MLFCSSNTNPRQGRRSVQKFLIFLYKFSIGSHYRKASQQEDSGRAASVIDASNLWNRGTELAQRESMKMMLRLTWANDGVALLGQISLIMIVLAIVQPIAAQTCGAAANNTLCQDGLCCSPYGFCGTTVDYCGAGCQSQCVAPPPPAPPVVSTSGLDKTVDVSLFEALFPDRNQFYTYNAFITAGNRYPEFGTQGDKECRLREIAAFAAHVQQETAGLVYITEIDKSFNYCDPTYLQYPCAANQSYYGRGPLQLSWNYNYGAASPSVGVDILAKPDKVAMNPALAFETSLWFWTHKSDNIPSIHDVLTGKYRPTLEDLKLKRYPGFGLTILIINGGIECGKVTQGATNRIKYFKQFSAQLGVKPGKFLTCDKMTPY